MKKVAMTIGVLVITACFLSGSLAFAEMPEPEPSELWNYITKVSPYKEWSFWPDYQGMQPGRSPHGRFNKVYVNDRALNSHGTPVQYGAIQVKESYNKAKELKAITVMYKVYGYNPIDGDWFWVRYKPDGKAGPYGKLESCISCHGTRASNDFILVHEFE